MAYLDGKDPAQRPDVRALHEAWKATFGCAGHVLHLGGAETSEASILARAIDTHTEAECHQVIQHAPNDPWVSGRADEQKNPHQSIAYIFGNETTFARILRDAEKAETSASGSNIAAKFAALEAAR